MKVRLSCSGGIGNLRVDGQLDTSELPEEVAKKVDAALAHDDLAAVDGVKGGPFMMDAQQYELVVMAEDASDENRRYELDDSALSDDLLYALDEIRAEIVRRQAAER